MTANNSVRVASCAIAVVVAVLAAGCTPQHPGVIMEGAQAFPGESVQDWVTYGDVAVTFTVISEREIPPTPAEVERGEGTITRMVTVERKGDPSWSRPSRAKDAATMPNQWEIANGGWLFHGDEKLPLFSSGLPTFVVGEEYLAVEAYSTCFSDHGEWVGVTFLPLQNGVITWPERASTRPVAGAAAVEGKSALELAAVLATTKGDPRAEKYMALDPCDRWQKVAENSHGPQELGPGEKPD